MKKRRPIIYPWVTFMLNSGHYCVSSKFVASMMLHQSFQPLPDHTPGLLGVMELLGDIIPVFDMRTLLGMKELQISAEAFEPVRDALAQLVQALHECAQSGRASDIDAAAPQAALNAWWDECRSDNRSLNFLLKKLHDKYNELEQLAAQELKLIESGEKTAVADVLASIDDCNQTLMAQLDELVGTYDEATRGILIILQYKEKKMGIRVDEISGVMHFEKVSDKSSPDTFGDSPYVSSIITNDNVTYLQLNIESLLELTNSHS